MKTTMLNLSRKLSLVLLSTCLSLALLMPPAALARNNAIPTEPASRARPAATAAATAARAPLARARAQAGAEPGARPGTVRHDWWTTIWWTFIRGR